MKFENTRRFADCVASIDVRRLYRLGLFGGAPQALFVRSPVDSAEGPEVEVQVAWDPQAREVRLSVPGAAGGRSQAVAVGRREKPRGGGYYFVCPVAGERCEKLYYVDGGWGGRQAKRLSYSSQNGSLADRHRHSVRRLTALLEGQGGRPLTPTQRAEIETRIAALEAKIAALPRRGAVRLRPDPQNYADLIPLARAAREAVPAAVGWTLGCEAALERGAALGDVEDSIGWMFHRADQLRDAAGRAPEGLAEQIPGLRPGFCEDHPRIGLRALQARGHLRPGWRRGLALDWTGLGCGLDRCTVLFDLRRDGAWFAALEIVAGRAVVEQSLRIVLAEDGEPRFVCPLSGAAVETVAYRAGAFAGPEALRLTRRAGRG